MTQAMAELVLQAISAVAALASGVFWIISACTSVPWPDMVILNGPAPSVMRALKRQSAVNATAAALAAVAALAQGLAIAVHEWPWPIPHIDASAAWGAELQALPNPTLTPGVVDPAITLNVICNRTTKERRRVSPAMKQEVLRSYGIPEDRSAYFEIDHLIPLAIGGSNVRANLWPQAWPEADRKDVCEIELQRRACVAFRALVPAEAAAVLAQEQREIATDWRLACARVESPTAAPR